MNYVEWKLHSEARRRKEIKRERAMNYRHRDIRQWGYYTQWSIPSLIVFALITIVILVVCIKCGSFIYEQFQSLV